MLKLVLFILSERYHIKLIKKLNYFTIVYITFIISEGPVIIQIMHLSFAGLVHMEHHL